MKKLFLLLLIPILLLCSCSKEPASLTIDIPKIGQADAILLQTTAHTVLIDTGEEDDAQELLDLFAENNISTIDYLIITHYDKDHIGSAARIISSVNVKHLIEPGYEKEGDLYSAYRNAAKSVETTVPKDTMSFSLDGVTFTVCPPMREYAEENDASLVIMAEYDGSKLLFTGDIMQERIDDLLTDGFPLDADFLKVPHHGKLNDSSTKLIEAVSPIGAVITSSDKNPADSELLGLLEAIGCDTLETRDGDICIELRGGKLHAKQ